MRIAVLGVMEFSEAGGGAIARLRNLALALKLAGQAPCIVVIGALSDRFLWQDIPVTVCPRDNREPIRRGGAWFWRKRVNDGAVHRMVATLSDLASEASLDAVIFYNQDMFYALRVAKACRRMRIPFIQQYAECHEAGDFATGWRNTYFLQEYFHLKLLPRRSAGAIVISRELERQVGARSHRAPLVIPTVTVVPTSTIRPLAMPPRVICISQGARRDDLPLLINAMARLREMGGGSTLHIVGLAGEATPGLSALVARLALADRVALMGFLPAADFNRELAEADAAVLLRADGLSSRACYPSRLHDLFGTGRPVIMSAVGDLPLYFQDGQTCLLVRGGDVEALGQKLLWIEQNRSRAAEIGQAGNRRAAEVFSPVVHGQALARYLASIHEHS